MNEREISELRRRFKAEHSNISQVRGCYVNDKGEILTQFTQSVNLMLEDEKEKVLAVLKKTLSGTLGKNLTDISFPTKAVMEGPEHKLLMTLRDTELKDDEAVDAFFKKVIGTVFMETNYLILLATDAYDVPYKGKDGGNFSEGSDQVFRYILCTVCPVKLSKSALSFHSQEQAFHNSKTDWIVGAPELGFLFPAFDSRATNLYGALAYSRNTADNHEEFVDAVFGVPAPMAAAQQQESFQSILRDTLEEDCSMEAVQSVHNQLSEMIQIHKEAREKEPLLISKPEVEHILKTSGATEEKIEKFNKEFDAAFGEQADVSPRNLVNPKQFQVITPDVKIQVAPDRKDLIETRVIGGVKYILIKAEEGVEVNGVEIEIS